MDEIGIEKPSFLQLQWEELLDQTFSTPDRTLEVDHGRGHADRAVLHLAEVISTRIALLNTGRDVATSPLPVGDHARELLAARGREAIDHLEVPYQAAHILDQAIRKAEKGYSKEAVDALRDVRDHALDILSDNLFSGAISNAARSIGQVGRAIRNTVYAALETGSTPQSMGSTNARQAMAVTNLVTTLATISSRHHAAYDDPIFAESERLKLTARAATVAWQTVTDWNVLHPGQRQFQVEAVILNTLPNPDRSYVPPTPAELIPSSQSIPSPSSAPTPLEVEQQLREAPFGGKPSHPKEGGLQGKISQGGTLVL